MCYIHSHEPEVSLNQVRLCGVTLCEEGSPEGLLGQLDDVGGGLHVDVVVVEGSRVGGGARLRQ